MGSGCEVTENLLNANLVFNSHISGMGVGRYYLYPYFTDVELMAQWQEFDLPKVPQGSEMGDFKAHTKSLLFSYTRR